jgi:hypothetical protein
VDQSAGESACWIWTALTNEDGYGRFWSKGSHVYAHRFAWQLVNGEIPAGMKVLHSCDNPPCCNPAHLSLGTQLENIQDMLSKGRGGRLQGEQKENAKLTDDLVVSLRNIFDDGIILASYRNKQAAIIDLAKVLEVAPETIRGAIDRRKWKHIE